MEYQCLLSLLLIQGCVAPIGSLKSLFYWYLSIKHKHPEYFKVIGEWKVFFHSVKCDQNSNWNKAQITVMEDTWVIFPVWYFLKSQQFYLCLKLFLTTLFYDSLHGLVYTFVRHSNIKCLIKMHPSLLPLKSFNMHLLKSEVSYTFFKGCVLKNEWYSRMGTILIKAWK